jgi:polar amino acid transport system substrate-binding protein
MKGRALTLAAVVACVSLGLGVSAAATPAHRADELHGADELVVALSLGAPGLQVGAVRGDDVVLARGFEVELARVLGRRLGVTRVRFVNRSRAALLAPGPKRWDIALAQLTATDVAARSVDSSRAYLAGGQAVLLRRGAAPPASLSGLADLALCVRVGSAGAASARALAPSVPPMRVADDDTLLRLVQTGRCDAALVDAARLGSLLDGRRARFSPARLRIGAGQGYVVALPKGSPLGAAVDKAIARLVARGVTHRLAERWLGLDPARLRLLGEITPPAALAVYPR